MEVFQRNTPGANLTEICEEIYEGIHARASLTIPVANSEETSRVKFQNLSLEKFLEKPRRRPKECSWTNYCSNIRTYFQRNTCTGMHT